LRGAAGVAAGHVRDRPNRRDQGWGGLGGREKLAGIAYEGGRHCLRENIQKKKVFTGGNAGSRRNNKEGAGRVNRASGKDFSSIDKPREVGYVLGPGSCG